MHAPVRQRKTKDPCTTCYLHRALCLCESIPKLELRTRVCLVIHAKELKRTTNTGRLALHALINSEMRVRGREREPLDLSDLLSPDYQPLLFYPSQDAVELSTNWLAQFEKPIQLIVPDGNWRQASKVAIRHPELNTVPRVMIKTPNRSTAFLRAESSEEGMATLQAIAHALGVIEDPAVKSALLDLYELKLQRTLTARGTNRAVPPAPALTTWRGLSPLPSLVQQP